MWIIRTETHKVFRGWTYQQCMDHLNEARLRYGKVWITKDYA